MRLTFQKRAGAAAMILLMTGSVLLVPHPVHASDADSPIQVAKDIGSFIENTLTAGSVGSLSVAYQARKGIAGTGIGLDTLGWTIGKIAIQMMTKSVVNWINSGFQGSPAFITNFSGFLTQVADVAAGNFIGQLSVNANLKSPFQSAVAQNTAQAYSLSSSQSGFFASIKYTLNGVTLNDSAFLAGNFSQGGWAAFYSASQNPQNNPIGAQMIATAQVKAQVAAAQGQQATQAGWGQGFLSWCGDATGGGGGSNEGGPCHTDDDCAGALACVDAPVGHCAVDASLDGNTATSCTNKDGSTGSIKTPGSVIQAQFNHITGLSGDTLVTADEFNEVIGALMSQLVSQILGGVGLTGTASVSAGGTGFIDQATNPTQTTQALGNSTANGTFANTINTETTALQQYQTDLQAILTAAQQGKTALQQCNKTDGNTGTDIDTLIANTQASLTKTAAALAALQKISSDATAAITASGSGLSTASPGLPSMTQVTAEYQAFLASPSTPSAADMKSAHDTAIALASASTDGSTSSDNGIIGTILQELKDLAKCGN